MLSVFHEERRVGAIDRAKAGLIFKYANEWLATEDSLSISLTMPLRAGRYPAHIATPWFANLLPDKRVR